MKNYLKRTAVLLMAGLMLLAGIAVPCRRAEAAMMYNNTNYATLSGSIDSNGDLHATMYVMGINGRTTKIEVALYVEKRVLGLFWTKVDIGCENNIWKDYTTKISYSNTFSTHLNSGGTYRITVTYTVSGSGGSSDTITKTETLSY
ncbi:MAG: hypothetical protein K6G56_03560 [Clostridiales bacterium]|nr:hypothetical protein [Clostridiales bacterium]